MKKTISILILVLFFKTGNAQVFITDKCTVTFFSASAMEDIEGINSTSKAIVNAKSGQVAIKLNITAFEFKSAFMKEHFNENYMESEKFPLASFSGTIKETVDLNTAGTFTVTVVGKMTMHGVEKEMSIPATLVISDKENFKAEAKFKIKPADFKIKIPSLVGQNIAEEVEVKFVSTFVPFKK